MSEPLLIFDVQTGFINPFTHHIPQRVARLIERDQYAPILFTRLINEPEGSYQRFLDWHSCDRAPEINIVPELKSFVDPIAVLNDS